ncbi:hypothetical protein [Psychrobacillus phage Perkons]|nr:hypothetical protein [Psychrobacillus phage Perkons]
MINPQKPLATRLDDIELKMDQLVEIFHSSLTKLDNSHDLLSDVTDKVANINIHIDNTMINKHLTSYFENMQNVHYEWMEVVNYCRENNVSPSTMLQLAKVMNHDFK